MSCTAWLRARLLAALWLALAGTGAAAHELSMAELNLRETSRGEFIVNWSAGEKSQPAASLKPAWPAQCQAEGNLLRCGPEGLSGPLSIQGVGGKFSAVIVKVLWLDSQSTVHTLSVGQPQVRLYGSADDQRGMAEIGWAYITLGIDHILTGLDHLLFVLALLFLVGFNRRLVGTITAFTVAHSLTLGLSAMGWLALRSPPVEAVIALSIVLVAAEALHRRETLARRWPALVAFGFGLIHGLGFAGAIKDIGLPEQHVLLALLSFNVGVEIGQLLMVFAAWVLWRVLAKLPRLDQARTVALYAMGAVAAYWTWLRVAGLLGVLAR
jgi:hydrogenase/urease accessory protein HupE